MKRGKRRKQEEKDKTPHTHKNTQSPYMIERVSISIFLFEEYFLSKQGTKSHQIRQASQQRGLVPYLILK